MKTAILILKLLFLGALFIASNSNLHLGVKPERDVFFHSYVLWLDTLVAHGTDVTSYVIKFEWLPIDESDFREPGLLTNFFSKQS